jgi:hypothetical protein
MCCRQEEVAIAMFATAQLVGLLTMIPYLTQHYESCRVETVSAVLLYVLEPLFSCALAFDLRYRCPCPFLCYWSRWMGLMVLVVLAALMLAATASICDAFVWYWSTVIVLTGVNAMIAWFAMKTASERPWNNPV